MPTAAIRLTPAEHKAIELAVERGSITIRTLMREIAEEAPEDNRFMLGRLHAAGFLTKTGKRRGGRYLFEPTPDARAIIAR